MGTLCTKQGSAQFGTRKVADASFMLEKNKMQPFLSVVVKHGEMIFYR